MRSTNIGKAGGGALSAGLSNLQTAAASHLFTGGEQYGVVLENYNADTLAQFDDSVNQNQNQISSMLNANPALEDYFGWNQIGASVIGESKSAFGEAVRNVALNLSAAASALATAANPLAHMRAVNAALESHLADTRGADIFYDTASGVQGIRGDFSDKYALEAFENQTTSQALHMTTMFNLAVAVQDPVLELFYKTHMMSPEDTGLFMTVALDRYYDGNVHDHKSKTNLVVKKHLLMDAIRHPERMVRKVLNVIPYFQEAGEHANAEHFAPKTSIAPVVETVAGVQVTTSPLRVGKEHNLLALSSHPGLLNGGVFNETDMIDRAAFLKNIYLSIGEESAEATDGLIRFPVRNLDRANFVKDIQGHEYNMILNFISDEFVIDKSTVNTSGARPTKLDALVNAGYSIRLEADVTAVLNLESSVMHVKFASVKVKDAVKVVSGHNGAKTIVRVDLNESTLKQELAKLQFAIRYFDPDTFRTNKNFRTMGILLDRDAYTAKFAIGIKSPIRIQREVGDTSVSDADVTERLINAAKVRQAADGWTAFLEYRDMLKQYCTSDMYDPERIPGILGLGKYLVTPYYEHLVIDLAEKVKTLQSANALENVREYIIGVMQEAGARAIYHSRWQIAAASQNNGNAVVPHFGIGCGQYLPLVLSVKGDLRLMGASYDSTVCTTQVDAMQDRIFMSLVNPNEKAPSALSFGALFQYPEVVTKISPHSTNGATVETFIVQQRYGYINFLPVLIEIEFKGLREFIQNHRLVQVEVSDDKSVLANAITEGIKAAK